MPRIAPAVLAMFASVFALPFAQPAQPAAAARAQCTNWTSTSEPPPDIAVYRVSEGKVERVDFRHYVMRVASREWGVKQPELRRAGVHAVKQYAWYHVLRWRGGTYNGECYDVKDTTADQLYANRPLDEISQAVKEAVNYTWTWRLFRDGKLIMTGYRRGDDVPCASDGGYRLYVRSARKCAAKGWSAGRILRTYYTASLVN